MIEAEMKSTPISYIMRKHYVIIAYENPIRILSQFTYGWRMYGKNGKFCRELSVENEIRWET